MHKSGPDDEKKLILSVLIGTDPEARCVRVIDGFLHRRLSCSFISPRGMRANRVRPCLAQAVA